MGLISNPTRLILVATIFFLVSSISGQDSVVENNERQESEGSGKELGRRGMVGTERIGVDTVVDNIGALGLNLDLDATAPSVFDALFSSFSMILVTEIGDETFIIAALMAMRHPKATVLSGALSALFVMTILSTGLGRIVPNLISTYFLATIFVSCIERAQRWNQQKNHRPNHLLGLYLETLVALSKYSTRQLS
jgi:hypothetical protein